MLMAPPPNLNFGTAATNAGHQGFGSPTQVPLAPQGTQGPPGLATAPGLQGGMPPGLATAPGLQGQLPPGIVGRQMPQTINPMVAALMQGRGPF